MKNITTTDKYSNFNTHTMSKESLARNTQHVDENYQKPYLTKLIHVHEVHQAEVESSQNVVCIAPNSGSSDSSEAILRNLAFNKMKICDTSNNDITKTIENSISNVQRKSKEPNLPGPENLFNASDYKHVTCATSMPIHLKLLPKTQSLDLADSDRVSMHSEYTLSQSSSSELDQQGTPPKLQGSDQARPIYPSLNYSPFSSPRIGRRRTPLRESRRVSIEHNGSFVFLNQYKLMDEIGQVKACSS